MACFVDKSTVMASRADLVRKKTVSLAESARSCNFVVCSIINNTCSSAV